MKLYLDVCSLNRPFDNQIQDRIHFESEAVLTILYHCQNKEWQLIGSEVVDFEVSMIPDPDRRQKVQAFIKLMKNKVMVDDGVEKRALELTKMGISAMDSLHIACAEKGKVDVLLTTDDHLIRKANQSNKVKIRIENPVKWLLEVVNHEYPDKKS